MYLNAARPKVRFTLWLHIQNKLLTTDRLHKWGLPGDLHCPLCHVHYESRDHLFVYYDYVRKPWYMLQYWMQLTPIQFHTWDHHLAGMIKRVKGKTRTIQILKMVYTEFVHCLWIERNMRIF
ncbi:hypothetical protein RND71_016716 [Anisodus tanguticus]|uniref:Reverse transcriptase zinc-binding domain-containing protein n=1 Tax=Anisodus tanguticus TaxID=243964 RepID=A0AAE1S9S2_9SOLA|nr:hypothetical protein RND71_016716 [Anisodus tanguticus]